MVTMDPLRRSAGWCALALCVSASAWGSVMVPANAGAALGGPPPGMGEPPAPAPMRTNQYNAPIEAEPLGGRPRVAVAIHGWNSSPDVWWRDGTNSWNNPNGTPPNPGARETLRTALGTNEPDWRLWGLDWRQGAMGGGFVPPTNTEINAQLQGQFVAKRLFETGPYEVIHLMGHSLGGRVAETAATLLHQLLPKAAVHTTFFDAYTPYAWDRVYGLTSTYSEHYYATLDGLFSTQEVFPHSLNVNMDAHIPPRPADWGGFGADATWRHASPQFFYKNTIRDHGNENFGGFGYNLSLESGQSPWPPTDAPFHTGLNVTLAVNGSSTAVPVERPVEHPMNGVNLLIDDSNITGRGLLVSGFVGGGVAHFAVNPITPLGYINFALETSRVLNFIEFDFAWGNASGDSRLSVWLDDQLLWATESLAAITDDWLSTGKIFWTGRSDNGIPHELPLPPGEHRVNFRFDHFEGDGSMVSITNFRGGFFAVPAPGGAAVVLAAMVVIAQRRRSITKSS